MQSDQYDDKPVFDMHTHTQKFIPEHYKGKKKVEAQVSKHGCLASSRDVDICVSVYHDGRYCDECLREGACETVQIIVASGSCRGFLDGQGKGEILSS